MSSMIAETMRFLYYIKVYVISGLVISRDHLYKHKTRRPLPRTQKSHKLYNKYNQGDDSCHVESQGKRF